MTVTDRVRQLYEAENQADRNKAEEIVAPDFVAITRRTGEEEGREKLLQRIANSPTPNPIREPDEFRVWESETIAVVRSRVRTLEPTTRAVTGEFRNLHVFRQEAGRWLCVNWQVTELKR